MRKRLKRVLGRSLLLFLSLSLSLIVMEAGLRFFYPGYSPLFLDIYRLDDHGLVALRPNISRRSLSSEWDVTVAVNGEGLRDRRTPVAADGGTLLAIGDSFAFGWGVELDESYLYLAEEALRHKRIRVVKAGFPGTGTIDQLRWLQTYGERYSPTLILLSVFIGNDFVDNQRGGVAGQYDVKDGLMVLRPLKGNWSAPWWSELRYKVKRSSLLAQRIAEIWWAYETKFLTNQQRPHPGLTARGRFLWESFKIHLRESPLEARRSVDVTLGYLNDIREWCRLRGIPMALLVIPRGLQIYEWEIAVWRQAFDLKDEHLDLDRPQRLLMEWAKVNRVPALDLLGKFRAYAKVHPDERLFFYPDSHMNATGHRVTAGLLADFLQSLGPREAKIAAEGDLGND